MRRMALRHPHDPHLGNELDAVHARDRLAHMGDEALEVGGARLSVVDDEVGVLLGYSDAGRVRVTPPRSMVVTASTCRQVSPPKAPAFIASAPPSVPGMPAKNSAGPSPHLMHCRAMRAQATPASARTVLSPVRSRRSSAPCVLTTTPFKPPSRTRRLLPSPIQWMGTAGGSERRNSASSTRSPGLKKTSAGPPTCQEVCRLK